jgi:hypothetical protein
MADATAEIVKTIIQTQVLQALKNAPEAIDAMVKAALVDMQVDPATGRTDGYYGSKVPYLEYIVGSAIRDAAHKAVATVIAERQPAIEAAIRKRLSADDMVQSMAKAFTKAAVDESWKIEINFEKER